MTIQDIRIPDIGDFKDVEVIEVLVKAGDTIKAEDSLVTVESDKASMEIPSPVSGVIKEMKLKVGDRVSSGSPLMVLEVEAPPPQPSPAGGEGVLVSSVAPPRSSPAGADTGVPPPRPSPAGGEGALAKTQAGSGVEHAAFKKAYATPSIRKFARELGVDLAKVQGTGRKGRITQQDVKGYVKDVMSFGGNAAAAANNGGMGIPRMPEIDFSQWGEVETTKLGRINKLTGEFLHRNWLNIPHVTQFDQADITELEAFRKELNVEQDKLKGTRITPLVFIMKAIVAGLKAYPRFNSSLDPSGENLIWKKYYNVGIAVDTPDGLVVPVIREVDKKSLLQLSEELKEVSAKARDKKLKPADMQGGSISISSLGGIGGTQFTPIVNAPEVAILGVSRSDMQPVWNGTAFVPRLMLPLSLSYDHRVIDGADGARFTSYLAKMLGDIRRLLV